MGFSVRTPVLVLLIALSAGCRKAHQSQHSSAVLPISVVVADAINYSHRLITVRGCYVEGYERTTLQPCTSKRHEDLVWLDSGEILASDFRSFIPETLVPKELKHPPSTPPEFVFKYDEMKTRAVWAKLNRIAPEGGEVTVTGQFDTVPLERWNSQSHYGFGIGFGHLGQYQHRLILVDVLDPERKR